MLLLKVGQESTSSHGTETFCWSVAAFVEKSAGEFNGLKNVEFGGCSGSGLSLTQALKYPDHLEARSCSCKSDLCFNTC